MSGDWASFLPGLAVLAVGLAAGLLLAARLRSQRERTGAAPVGADGRDLELERADLEARRAEIYARLRGEGDEELGEADRRDFELQAARTLRRLEEIDGLPGARQRRRGAQPPAAAATPDRPRRAHPGLTGFAYGATFAALVGLLLYWAVRDETPRPPERAAPMAAPDDDTRSRLDQLSPESRARVSAIEARLAEEPSDLDARKALAETYVVEGLFFEAFEQSERILELRPDDADGLYFQGLIRLTMGQDTTAIELLDRALESEPGFVSARLVRGLARLRLGDRDAATEDWRLGLQAAGGEHQGLERLLTMAAAGASVEEILGSPPERSPSADPAAASGPLAGGAGAAPASGSAPRSGGAYRVRVELAPGATAPPGAILFVNLRIVAGAGPPAAVKRIDAPRFPVELTLDAGDAMPGLGGRPLPANGVVSARLDADGNASTRDPSEPSAQADAAIEQDVTLVLR